MTPRLIYSSKSSKSSLLYRQQSSHRFQFPKITIQLLTVILLGFCAGNTSSLIADTAKPTGKITENKRNKSVKDSRGRTVSLANPPIRIASGSLASDEIIIELLKRTNHPERLIAVSVLASNFDYSNVTKNLTKITGRVGTETESTLKLKPDLVLLANFNRPELINRLDDAGLKTFVLGDFSSIEDIKKNIITIGKLIHAPKAALALKTELTNSLKKYGRTDKKQGKRKVLSWSLGGLVMGKDTIFDSIANAAGAENLASKIGLSGWPILSAEKVIGLKPDFIVTGGEVTDKEKALRALRSTPGWKDLSAVKSGRIIMIPQRHLFSTSHHILKAVEMLSRKLSVDSAKLEKK